MAKKLPLTGVLREEYEQLFASSKIRPECAFEVDAAVTRITQAENRARYEVVEGRTGIPWYIIGIIHGLEASWNFARHLHNGDPLTARTVNVPAGRPETGSPPFKWEESAADALEEISKPEAGSWGIADIAYALELWNGTGYRLYHPHVKSPYLWSYTTIYTSGKYVADGKWSDTAKSRQCGAMAILKRMIERGFIQLSGALRHDDKVADDRQQPEVDVTADVAAVLSVPPPYPGHVLRRGNHGEDVKLLQRQLKSFGVGAELVIDGDFGEKTEWAVRLFQARSLDEAGDALEVDGVVGAVTWSALFGSSSVQAVTAPPVFAPDTAKALADEVLRVAAGEIGVREDPIGSNDGPRVGDYLKAVDKDLVGNPWCVAFIYWCFEIAAKNLNRPNPMPRTASVWRHWEKAPSVPGSIIVTGADAREDPSLVRPGMIFHIDTGGRSGHAGLVVEVVGDRLVTIEGNTNDNGSREGIGVFVRKTRRVAQVNMGFVGYA